MPLFKGTASLDQDSRFKKKDDQIIAKTKFPKIFGTTVDMKKVNLDVLRPWINERIVQLMGIEDEIAVEYAIKLLEDSKSPNPKEIYIQLKGFLEDKSMKFVKSLWEMLVSAQENATGVPQVLLDKKRQELEAERQKKQQERDRIQKDRESDRRAGTRSRYTESDGRHRHYDNNDSYRKYFDQRSRYQQRSISPYRSERSRGRYDYRRSDRRRKISRGSTSSDSRSRSRSARRTRDYSSDSRSSYSSYTSTDSSFYSNRSLSRSRSPDRYRYSDFDRGRSRRRYHSYSRSRSSYSRSRSRKDRSYSRERY